MLDTKTQRRLNRQLDIQNVVRAAFSPDARRFAACSILGYAGIWETETLQPVAFLGERENQIFSVKFSPDGSRLITGSMGANGVTVWDVATLLPLISFETAGAQHVVVGFSPDGNYLFSGAGGRPDSRGLYLWRAPSWEEIEREEGSRRAANTR